MEPAAHSVRTKLHLIGILHIFGAAASFAAMAALVKWAASRLPVFEVVFARSLAGCLMIVPLMMRRHVSFLGRDWGRLLLRGTSGAAAVCLYFFTLSKLPLGTAVMLNFTSPIFSALLATLFLKERPGFFLWIMIWLSFFGLFLLTEARLFSPDLYILCGLASGIFAAIASVAIRSVHHAESPLTIIFYFTFIATVASAVFLPRNFRWPDAREWLVLGGIAVTSFYGQLWFTVAFRQAPASLLSPFAYLTPAFSFLLGVLIWQDPVTPRTLLGASIIIFAGSCVSLREAISS